MAHVDLARPTGLEKDEPRAVGCGFFCGRTHAGVIRGGGGESGSVAACRVRLARRCWAGARFWSGGAHARCGALLNTWTMVLT